MKDKRIDNYIAKASDFAKPVLLHLRELIHKACPDVNETMKWSFPHFEYKGGILCSMASFKQHCSFGFWKASLMKDYDKIFQPVGETGMGHFGQIKGLEDLPADKIIIQYIKEAAKLNESGAKVERVPGQTAKNLIIPPYFKKALASHKKASKTFNDFTYSNKKEYVDWVTEAKTEATRLKRMETSIEWMSEGKIRNWKYVRK